jgi:glycosyltransferase involved in cell wall biosynthesis
LFCLTEEEQAIARGIAPDTASFLLTHHAVVRADPPGFAGRSGILFFGGFMAGAGSPNEDTVRFVVREVLPHLWAYDPDLVFHVVGADPTEAVRALSSDRVRIVGFVDDPEPWFDQTLVHVAPVRFGAGLKLKFVDTMAAGQPFVTSTVGAEGFGLGALTPLLVADEPQEIADRVRNLCADQAVWEEAQRELLALAGMRFGRDRFRHELVDAMSHVGVAPPA